MGEYRKFYNFFIEWARISVLGKYEIILEFSILRQKYKKKQKKKKKKKKLNKENLQNRLRKYYRREIFLEMKK